MDHDEITRLQKYYDESDLLFVQYYLDYAKNANEYDVSDELLKEEYPNLRIALDKAMKLINGSVFRDLVEQVGWYTAYLGDFYERNYWIKQAIHSAISDNNEKESVRFAIMLSSLLQGIDREKSQKLADSCIEYSEKIGDLKLLALAHNNMGMVYADTIKHDMARHMLEMAGQEFETLKEYDSYASVLNNLGIYWTERNYFKANYYFIRALALKDYSKKLNNSLYIYNLGHNNLIHKKLFEAEIYLRASLESEKSYGMTAMILNELGLIEYYKGRFNKANFLFSESLSYVEKKQDFGLKRTLLNNLANIQLETGNLKKAKLLLKKANEINLQIEGENTPITEYQLGNLEFYGFNFKEAREHFRESINLSIQRGSLFENNAKKQFIVAILFPFILAFLVSVLFYQAFAKSFSLDSFHPAIVYFVISVALGTLAYWNNIGSTIMFGVVNSVFFISILQSTWSSNWIPQSIWILTSITGMLTGSFIIKNIASLIMKTRVFVLAHKISYYQNTKDKIFWSRKSKLDAVNICLGCGTVLNEPFCQKCGAVNYLFPSERNEREYLARYERLLNNAKTDKEKIRYLNNGFFPTDIHTLFEARAQCEKYVNLPDRNKVFLAASERLSNVDMCLEVLGKNNK